LLALARIKRGVREGKVGVVPELSATSPSVLATLNRSKSKLGTSLLYLY
jgi:hypothetical protein